MDPLLSLAALAVLCGPARAQQVTPPAAHLGRPVAADRTLADWGEVSSYFKKLDQESARVRVEVVGRTTEGREFLLAAVSGERNLARLDEIKRHAARLADPRGASAEEKRAALEQGLPILMVSNAMHSTETAAPQFAMELAWRLATSDEEPYRAARERLLVLILPCTNPDGLDHVVEWYRRTVGTPYEASGLTRLYQEYAGHDNNRDWFMLSLEETRIVTRLLYADWHPHVYWDVHQQGRGAERMFVPPFRDPLNPNLDPAIVAGIGTLGSRALHDMTRDGFTGVASGVTFDMWWNGGNRNVPVRHNIVGLLTEAASVELATPVFLRPEDLRPPSGLGHYAPSNRFPAPWPGGWWRLRDVVDYEHAFARSVLRSLASEPRFWLENALEAAGRAIEKGQGGAPKAWLIPSDNLDHDALGRLAETLLACGVELSVAAAPLRADGREYPAGSIAIRRDQPYGQHVKDLFEVQRYPEGDPPYDVAGWTLPLLLGVQRVEVVGALQGELRRARTVEEALAGMRPDASTVEGTWLALDGRSWIRAFQALSRGESLAWDGARGGFRSPEGLPRSTWKRLPRVGLYAPWSGSMDEGWTRWVLERFGLAFVLVRNEMLRAGRLGDLLDVLVIPDVGASTLDQGRRWGSVPEEYAGGLDPEGAIAVEEFVRRGGTLVAWSGAAAWAIELLNLPLVDVARGKDAGDFSCPGSVLRAIPSAEKELSVTRNDVLAGLPTSLSVFFSRSAAWREATAEERKGAADGGSRELDVLLRYAPTRTLLSGWIRSPGTIAGRAAWVRAKHGEGIVHLFGFSPVYRSWSQNTFQLLFRAILLEGRE